MKLDNIIVFVLFSTMVIFGVVLLFKIPTRYYSAPMYNQAREVMMPSILIACDDEGRLYPPDNKHCETRDGRYHIEYVEPFTTYEILQKKYKK